MWCFLACFGSSKDKKRRNRRPNREPSGARDQERGYADPVKRVLYPVERLETLQQAILLNKIKSAEGAGSLNEGKLESSTGLISEFQNWDRGVDALRDGFHELEQEEASTKKDNMESPSSSVSRSVESSGDKSSSRAKKKVVLVSVIKSQEPLTKCELLEKDSSGREKTKSMAEPSTSNAFPEAGSSTLSFVSYPPNNRYQNCRESDDKELDYDGSHMDVGEDEAEEDEYSDGCALSDSPCSTESSTGISAGDGISPEVNSHRKNTEEPGSIQGREAYDQSMLNPIKNLSQWKALKAREKQPLLSWKENSASDLQEMTFGSYSSKPDFKEAASLNSIVAHPEQQSQPIAVDASLSNWLSSPETKSFQNHVPQQTVSQGSSCKNLKDRPIIGALTVEELRLMSRTSFPRTSPTNSPDDIAIIGTVGSYWRSEGSEKDSGSVSSYKGIPNTTSKYREDKRVNWHSTPFETRLEKALSRGSART